MIREHQTWDDVIFGLSFFLINPLIFTGLFPNKMFLAGFFLIRRFWQAFSKKAVFGRLFLKKPSRKMDGLFDFFHFVPFAVGVTIGVTYILMGGRGIHEIIYKYPHPTTVDALVYKDPNGACYRYKVEQVNCNKHEGDLKEYPLSG